MRILENIEPKEVFYYFEEISKIPRGSGNEKEISDYLLAFGQNLGLETIQDSALNIIIKKPATEGYENAPVVIIQGHMDMVCEKNNDTVHDFLKDPIKLRVDGDNIFATGTTLGADNGIAVAYAMAVLSSKEIPHPALEVLITTDEETGMGGAMAVEKKNLDGKILLNIDSEEEGYLLVSCAGGMRANVSSDIKWESKKEEDSILEITVRGLKGGHSGMEIDKERGNSNKLMGRVLMDLLSFEDVRLVSINGGSKDNAIPREMDGIITLNKSNVEAVKERVKYFNDVFKNELNAQDPEVKLEAKELNKDLDKVFSRESTEKAVKILYLIPNGINTRSMAIEGLVESSLNLGVVKTTDTHVEYHSAIRSSVGSLKEEMLRKIEVIAETLGAKVGTFGDYPEWQYQENSKIREICERVHKDMTGEDAKIIAIHAGLECGLFKEKLGEDVDMISFGPNLYDVHTPNEHMSISSVKNLWDYLLRILKEIK